VIKVKKGKTKNTQNIFFNKKQKIVIILVYVLSINIPEAAEVKLIIVFKCKFL